MRIPRISGEFFEDEKSGFAVEGRRRMVSDVLRIPMRVAFKIAGVFLIALGLLGAGVALVPLISADTPIWFKVSTGLWMVALMGALPIVIGVKLSRCEAASISDAAGQAAGISVWVSLVWAVQRWDLQHRLLWPKHEWIPDIAILNGLIDVTISLGLLVGPIWLGIRMAGWVSGRLAPVLRRRLAGEVPGGGT